MVTVVCPSQVQAELRVVATIPPLHSLAASVLDGVAIPTLLIKGARSPHDFTLRPSDIRLLNGADLILRIDGSFETGIGPVISRLGGKVPVLSWMQIDGVKRLRFRGSALRPNGAAVPAADHAPPHVHDPEHQPSTGQEPRVEMQHYDPHLWLDPANAIIFVRALAKAVGALDAVASELKDRANQNTDRLVARLTVLDAELKARLAPVKSTPFLTYHDAYHYFEYRYAVKSLGAVVSGAHGHAGVRHLAEVRQVLKSGNAACLFTEPQFPPKLAQRLTDGTSVRLAPLDPLGADITPGAEQYFTLMQALGNDLANCLGAK